MTDNSINNKLNELEGKIKELENLHLELIDTKHELYRLKTKHVGLWLNNRIIGTLVIINFILWLIRYL